MIFEYALEPEMVSTWGDLLNYRYYIREFGSEQGRLVSRYPKKWVKKVWESFVGCSVMERKRLEELLAQMKYTMVKRRDYVWNDAETWLTNVSVEHARHPFRAVLVRSNPTNQPEILDEEILATPSCPAWDNSHGMIVKRDAEEMAEAIKNMLACSRWVKFIDPYISPSRSDYRPSLQAFLKILASERPVGPPDLIEIHTGLHSATADFLKQKYLNIIPSGLQVTVYQWKTIPNEQELHNRYVLTDLGGVSFLHGLDTGRGGNNFDDVNRLSFDQYTLRCKQYNPVTPAFDQAAEPLIITSNFGR